MDPDPGRPVEERLTARLPRLRRFARALACDARNADALVAATIERALVAGEEESPIGLLVACWREQTDRHAPDPALDMDGAMGALPAEQRAAVALVLVEGLRYGDAAEILDIPIDTLSERLALGREALAARLAA